MKLNFHMHINACDPKYSVDEKGMVIRMRRNMQNFNMKEQGIRMLKSIGLAALASFGFYFLHAPLLCYIFAGIASILGIILFILLMIEHREG